MKITELNNNELYSFLKIGDLLSNKYFRESNFNKNSEKEYLNVIEIMNKLYDEANKRLKKLN